ncbi:MAG: IclR family transcriptional regulator [Comamonadaceae bacterium]|nr:MAG: IclR family transcriptional regulator [Comamonadaceae bacterium]
MTEIENGDTKTNGSEKAPGSQTLARGLSVIQAIAENPSGLTAGEVAALVGIHRTVVYRLLTTFEQFHYVARSEGGRFRPASGLAVLGSSYDNGVRDMSIPILRQLAEDLRATTTLLVAEGDEQVSIAVVVPAGENYQFWFREGSRLPIEKASGGIALLAGYPPKPGEREVVTRTRELGWVITHGEVEPNMYGLAAPVYRPYPSPRLCINVITHRQEIANNGITAIVAAAQRLAEALR